MQDKRFFWSHDGKAFLAYAGRVGINVVLGRGIGPEESVRSLYREFREESRQHGWRIAFYQVPASMSAALAFGLRYRIGSEAILDLKALTLDGRAMSDLRHEVSRGRRNGVTTAIAPAPELDDRTRAEMGAIAATWLRRRALG
jgi:phosphatidylglycerol lysyltransferase